MWQRGEDQVGDDLVGVVLTVQRPGASSFSKNKNSLYYFSELCYIKRLKFSKNASICGAPSPFSPAHDQWVRLLELLVFVGRTFIEEIVFVIMPRKWITPDTIKEAVEQILPYLEDTSNTAHKSIYFNGWDGLAASAVLREIAKDPPPSLLRKFSKIIHIDCSSWKSRRALQKIIVEELNLPCRVMNILDRQDKEDDFRGVDEGSRAEMRDVGAEIYEALREHKCLVVFHNGSENTIDMNDFGIPLSVWGSTRVLWTFRGRLRLNLGIERMVDNSHLFLDNQHSNYEWNSLLKEEAREIARYTDMPSEAIVQCLLYLLSLNNQGGDIMDYNWVTHASSYVVCDEIIQGGQADESWKLAVALYQQIHLEDYSSNVLPYFCHKLDTPPKRWILTRDNSSLPPEATSCFLAAVTSISDPPLGPLPDGMFHQSEKLRVLKLCGRTFSFSSPPFRCCRNLRFLGIYSCKDQGVEEVNKQNRPKLDFCKNLWVLDMNNTDWELDLTPEIIEQMAANIREVHIKKGRFWHINFAWRQLQNLQKLRLIEPTCPWETGEKDEFTNMVKLEFLDLSGNSTMQVMPSLSGATILKTLVLDGCVGLVHVGPEGLPPLLETFSLDAGPIVDQSKGAKISRISLASCARLVEFRLCGALLNLEEIDLSGTMVKTLVLKDDVVLAPSLQKIILLGCLQLHAILWPKNGLSKLNVLQIQSLVCYVRIELQQTYATVMDKRVEEESYKKEKTGPGSSRQICPPQPISLISSTYSTYIEVDIDNIAIYHHLNKSAPQFQPLGYHVQIGEGISSTRLDTLQGMKTIIFVMGKAESMHVHDNSFITTTVPEDTLTMEETKLDWKYLKQCHVARCPKMQTVFITNYGIICFHEIETFRADDLLMVQCIWSNGKISSHRDTYSFAKLQSIHLYSCPRLRFVLPLSWNAPGSYFPNLETLHIINCGDMKDVFPVEPMFLTMIAADQRKGILEFPKLKHIYMHELHRLQHICEANIFAPKLETFRLRGCWGLRRLPSVAQDSQPVVDCEKNWWEKLEWDGMEAGHDPSLFKPHHSSHYKKPLPRVSVLL
ncbi:uncharacterized protein LOC124650172 [Lolium rigidum]|uniref:uncharacterized protein LOC124650172 n=1 Tax=Lolium rigidum TaxID=89674 RepID=UPI001F5D244A|nr:uncharacterized protein LOC124650172 [Lolium rigidum]